MLEDEWSDEYDRVAIEARGEYYIKVVGSKATSGYNPMLLRELLPSAEYADDMLPFCSENTVSTTTLGSRSASCPGARPTRTIGIERAWHKTRELRSCQSRGRAALRNVPRP